MRIDREEIIKLISEHNWIKLFEIFKINENYIQIQEDNILSNMMDTLFVNELISDFTENGTPTIKYLLGQFYVLHKSLNHKFQLSDVNYKKLVLRLMVSEENIEIAYKYAQVYPEESESLKIIDQYNKIQPNIISHSLEDKLHITQNKDISLIDARIGLFKSKQEYYFYQAIIECYPMYLVFPNVSLNAIIDFDTISKKLSNEEKHFFWKGLIDCVIINPANDYKAIAFYELDSSFHDNAEQKKRDLMKDSILAKSGQILERIRPKTNKYSKDDFLSYIRNNKQIDL